ncbi:FAD-dependent oxidoreductase [Haloarchaeobius amylolyticus]|uniref:FAD-dependent oxidoreductase n=1 Tax=Haloarchaeobius amylolyticus TaxID=1198296 RepID=UPI00226FF70F|nr:FAD-dependent oxidoreductase [Haloarchaeobius amylolyticus]
MTTFVIVGGDAAGMSAASKAKREDPDMDVVVFEKGAWVSYAACGMPYYIKGEIETIDDLVQVTPDAFREERDIDLRTNHEVVAIDTDAQTVTVEGPDGTFEQPYDDLLVATGAHAIVPPFEGRDLDGVYTLHDLDSAEELRGIVDGRVPEEHAGYGSEADSYADHVETVAVVGGGYVGLEMAEAFRARGLDVHLFEMLPHVLQPFGEAVAPTVEEHLREQGVHLHLDTAVDRFHGANGHVVSLDADGEEYDVDLVLLGVGVAPNSDLAADAGIAVGESGAVATDEYGRTNVEHVYAAGDCAESRHAVTGEPDHVPLALTANRAGRAIGQTVTGDPEPVGDIVGTAVVKVFDLAVARTGIVDEDEAREHGFDPVSVTITGSSRAHYYPDAQELEIHMVGDRESGKLLGASMVGREGVAKRIDTVATALHAGMTVGEVEGLDLAYAPPFSPVWDPVLTAAKVLGGKLD